MCLRVYMCVFIISTYMDDSYSSGRQEEKLGSKDANEKSLDHAALSFAI